MGGSEQWQQKIVGSLARPLWLSIKPEARSQSSLLPLGLSDEEGQGDGREGEGGS